MPAFSEFRKNIYYNAILSLKLDFERRADDNNNTPEERESLKKSSSVCDALIIRLHNGFIQDIEELINRFETELQNTQTTIDQFFNSFIERDPIHEMIKYRLFLLAKSRDLFSESPKLLVKLEKEFEFSEADALLRSLLSAQLQSFLSATGEVDVEQNKHLLCKIESVKFLIEEMEIGSCNYINLLDEAMTHYGYTHNLRLTAKDFFDDETKSYFQNENIYFKLQELASVKVVDNNELASAFSALGRKYQLRVRLQGIETIFVNKEKKVNGQLRADLKIKVSNDCARDLRNDVQQNLYTVLNSRLNQHKISARQFLSGGTKKHLKDIIEHLKNDEIYTLIKSVLKNRLQNEEYIDNCMTELESYFGHYNSSLTQTHQAFFHSGRKVTLPNRTQIMESKAKSGVADALISYLQTINAEHGNVASIKEEVRQQYSIILHDYGLNSKTFLATSKKNLDQSFIKDLLVSEGDLGAQFQKQLQTAPANNY